MAEKGKHVKETSIKKLQDELDLLNRRGKSKPLHTIESAGSFQDLGTNIAREEMFKCIKELYGFSKRVLDQLIVKDTGGNKSTAVVQNLDPTQLGDMIKEQLSGILPGMLQAALKSNDSVQNKSQAGCSTSCDHDQDDKSHTLEIQKITDEADADDDEAGKITQQKWTTVVKKDVRGALRNVPVVKAATSANGTAKLHFRTQDDLNRATEALEPKYKVTATSEERKKLDPKLTIAGLDSDIEDGAMLLEELVQKNDFISDNKGPDGQGIKVVFFDSKSRFAVLQVSAKMREEIRKNDDRLCVGLERYLVKDRYHVVQCYHCQEFGHMSKSPFCKTKDEDPTCFYCAGRHASKDCKNKKERKTDTMKCSNCAASKNRSEKGSCTSHKASDTLCPFYIREKERLMDRTAASGDAKNLYRLRIREIKLRVGRV